MVVNLIASYPLPSKSILCPGRTESEVSASGAPRKILGMNDTNICETAIETINIARENGSLVRKFSEKIIGISVLM